MREILFRGKRTDNGEWVQGVPFFEEDRCYIIEDLFICDEYPCTGAVNSMVIPETVGQYIEREDVHGKKAFEGDIVKHDGGLFHIRYYAPQMMYYFHGLHGRGGKNGFIMTDFRFEIVGNIYDNPELLEGER